nr:uncharacterized protein I203_01221 [Kwoniella mangroviensis CBS 8507]OCF69364.1 hypothetical protein I203_01221 [Kwoniella mangroviensis CBS 8507]
MLSTALISASLLALATITIAQDFPAGYTGCYTFPASGQPTGLNPAEFNLPHNNRAPHAFFWYTIDPTNEEVAIPNCRCSYPPPPIDTWKHGAATGDCIVEAVGDSYGSYLTRPTHEFTGCYDLIDSSSPAAFPVNSPEDCLSTCPTSTSNLRYTVIQVDQSNNWSCRCITDVTDILPFPETVLIDCDIGAYFIYRYTSTVTPSQAVRKRLHQRRILSGGKKEMISVLLD